MDNAINNDFIKKNLSVENLTTVYKKNYLYFQKDFMKFQSIFLSDIYKRYNNDLDSANIVLFFAKKLHGQILRQKDTDLNYDISFESFWDNHSKISQEEVKIVEISKATGLPKETSRRKIQDLIKTNVLKKIDKRIYWSPSVKDKDSYNLIVTKHVDNILDLLKVVSNKLNLEFDKEKTRVDILNNYSFYTFHYLKTQLLYLKFWQKKINDLELLLIGIELSISANHLLSEKQITFDNYFIFKKANFKDTGASAVSASLVSNTTGIPRATCIRKLEKLAKMKIVKKNDKNKKYYLDSNSINSDFGSKDATHSVIEIFSEFYSIILKAFLKNKN